MHWTHAETMMLSINLGFPKTNYRFSRDKSILNSRFDSKTTMPVRFTDKLCHLVRIGANFVICLATWIDFYRSHHPKCRAFSAKCCTVFWRFINLIFIIIDQHVSRKKKYFDVIIGHFTRTQTVQTSEMIWRWHFSK